MERNYKLYVHIAPNGKKYYGITKRKPEYRWNNGKGYRYNQHFTSAINKYGWSNIEHIVLHEGLDEDEAKELEQYMIQWYDTANRIYGYNNSLGGEGANGRIQSEETRKKQSEAKMGKYIGKKSPVAKSVICITTNKVFDTVSDGANCYNISGTSSISKCCNGKAKSAGKSPTGEKLYWKYIDIIEL